MSAVMTDQNRTLAVNATSKGIFAQQLHEYVQEPGIVNLYFSAAALGVFATVNIGNKVICQDQAVSFASPARMPIRPDDLLVAGVVVRPGDRIVVDLRNATGATIICNTICDILS